jgi:hypothetical protein
MWSRVDVIEWSGLAMVDLVTRRRDGLESWHVGSLSRGASASLSRAFLSYHRQRKRYYCS